MAHGTTATVKMVAIEYTRTFARAGRAVLIYDHRNFGSSDGEPRLQINPWIQCRGYLDALSFASIRPEVDPERIGLWGDSYTGGQVVVVSACDPRPNRPQERKLKPSERKKIVNASSREFLPLPTSQDRSVATS